MSNSSACSMGACGGFGRHHRGCRGLSGCPDPAAGWLPVQNAMLCPTPLQARCTAEGGRLALEAGRRHPAPAAAVAVPPADYFTARPAGVCRLQTRVGCHPLAAVSAPGCRERLNQAGGSPAPAAAGAGGAKSTRIGLYWGREGAGGDSWGDRGLGMPHRRPPRAPPDAAPLLL